MGNYFYRVCECGIICGLLKRLSPERYRNILNLFCSLLLFLVILQPVYFDKNIVMVNDTKNVTDAAVCEIYSSELEKSINKMLEESAYDSKIENIHCECKEGEIDIVNIVYIGDKSAGDYVASIAGIPRDRVVYSG